MKSRTPEPKSPLRSKIKRRRISNNYLINSIESDDISKEPAPTSVVENIANTKAPPTLTKYPSAKVEIKLVKQSTMKESDSLEMEITS